MEYIIPELESELRQRAVMDHLLRTTVPELAVLLIKEDMRARDQTARGKSLISAKSVT
jgi:hypothetical protein